VPGWVFGVFGRGRREGQILARIFTGGAASRMAQFSLMLGIAYCIGPIDLIPARIPYFGHLDEACALIASFIVARGLTLGTLDAAPPAAPRGCLTCLPNFFIVGAARCGTTSLFAALSQHPDIFCCPVKEPNHSARIAMPNPG
jgi:hypothetical protein